MAGYRAVLFDLLTALLDSWTLRNRVAPSDAVGLAGRREYLRRTCEAGYYKPHPRPYRLALERLGHEARDVLFVAGSASDVPGAAAVGLPVFWHNRRRVPASDVGVTPLGVAESLAPVLTLAGAV